MNLTKAQVRLCGAVFRSCLESAETKEAAESIAQATRLLASVFSSAGSGAGFSITDWFQQCGLTASGEIPDPVVHDALRRLKEA